MGDYLDAQDHSAARDLVCFTEEQIVNLSSLTNSTVNALPGPGFTSKLNCLALDFF